MTVLSLASPELPLTEVDLFAAEPFPFEPAYRRALIVSIGATRVTAAGFDDLVALERWRAGRRISRTSKPSKRFGASPTETGMNDHERRTSFERAAREQRRAWLRTTPEQRIEWLEQAKRFAAEAMAAARRRRAARPVEESSR